MTKLQWDRVGERIYETGTDHGVLYLRGAGGNYDRGYAWNGLTAVTESPSGAESSAQYADNIKYLNLTSAEEFGGTIEAFTYPEEFAVCDGSAKPAVGLAIGQQTRQSFGLSYRSLIGNDVSGTDFGYKIHLIYGALAAPTEKAYATVNDSPEAITFSWEITTTPVEVPGFKPSATLTIDSTTADKAALASLEAILYGTEGTDPRLPLPAEVIGLFGETAATIVSPEAPSFDSASGVITIPATTGVIYSINSVDVEAGAQPAITEDVIVSARPAPGYQFPAVVDDDWMFTAP